MLPMRKGKEEEKVQYYRQKEYSQNIQFQNSFINANK